MPRQALRVVDGTFLAGPVPFAWLGAARVLGVRPLALGLALWRQAKMVGTTSGLRVGRDGLNEVGLSRSDLSRALHRLESAALVECVRRPGAAARVSLQKREGVPALTGPVPMSWLRTARALGANPLALGLVIWRLAEAPDRLHELRVPASSCHWVGLDTDRASVALTRLVDAGLVRAERRVRGRERVVDLISRPGAVAKPIEPPTRTDEAATEN